MWHRPFRREFCIQRDVAGVGVYEPFVLVVAVVLGIVVVCDDPCAAGARCACAGVAVGDEEEGAGAGRRVEGRGRGRGRGGHLGGKGGRRGRDRRCSCSCSESSCRARCRCLFASAARVAGQALWPGRRSARTQPPEGRPGRRPEERRVYPGSAGGPQRRTCARAVSQRAWAGAHDRARR